MRLSVCTALGVVVVASLAVLCPATVAPGRVRDGFAARPVTPVAVLRTGRPPLRLTLHFLVPRKVRTQKTEGLCIQTIEQLNKIWTR